MKTQFNIFKLLAVLISFSAVSCVELELEPYDRETDQTFWQKPEAGLYAINACYPTLSSAAKVFYSDAMTDNGYTKVPNAFNQSIGNGSYSTANEYVQNEWSDRYSGIRACNLLLNNIDQVPELSEELSNRYSAEAKVIRAYHYFELYSKFGNVSYATDVISIDQSQSVSRTEKEVIVEELLNDLDEIINNEYLPSSYSGDDVGRITHWAAMALKARILLFEGKYPELLDVTGDIINDGPFALFEDYESLFSLENENNSEVILDLQYLQSSREHSDQYHFLPPSLGGYSQLSPVQSLVDSYLTLDGYNIEEAPAASFDPENPYENRDPRLKATVVYDGNSYPLADGSDHFVYTEPGSGQDAFGASSDVTATGYYLKKYWDKNYRANLMSGLNIILIRYADVLLMHAEALVETSGMDEQGWNLTIRPLRERAGFSDAAALGFPGGSTDELRFIVRNERRTELAFEGLRHKDIIRWGIAEDVLNGWVYGMEVEGVQGMEDGHVAIEERSFDASKHYLWPVPQTERDLNSNLSQNPNW
ncbi:RagB/SusD family nutrient uptake outer membrane protein [Marinilabilia salmonicolor]|uniref:RagB/SusD family nutrient uptake outer membrane protein n=1 Tax=Marinilabilia salmonicolor TaxID=989 RepID=UPI00029A8E23|nr:RagB/SusD family nutrient uptake outer membrane protein [Marinilabilia salmonicolor]